MYSLMIYQGKDFFFFFFFLNHQLVWKTNFHEKKKNLHITATEKRGYYPHDIFLISPMEQVACNEYYNTRFCGEITKSIITFQLKRSPLSEAMYIFFIVGKIFNPPNHIVLWKYENKYYILDKQSFLIQKYVLQRWW